jgi:hypothetical protein
VATALEIPNVGIGEGHLSSPDSVGKSRVDGADVACGVSALAYPILLAMGLNLLEKINQSMRRVLISLER